MSVIDEAKELIKKFNVPSSLEADWEGTNHYELHDLQTSNDNEEYFWLDVEDSYGRIRPCETIEGQRLGYCLEAAVLLPKLIKELEDAKTDMAPTAHKAQG